MLEFYDGMTLRMMEGEFIHGNEGCTTKTNGDESTVLMQSLEQGPSTGVHKYFRAERREMLPKPLYKLPVAYNQSKTVMASQNMKQDALIVPRISLSHFVHHAIKHPSRSKIHPRGNAWLRNCFIWLINIEPCLRPSLVPTTCHLNIVS